MPILQQVNLVQRPLMCQQHLSKHFANDVMCYCVVVINIHIILWYRVRACDVNNGRYRKPVTHRCHLSVPWTMLGPTEADRPHSDHPTVDSLSAVPHCDDAGPVRQLLAYEMAIWRAGGLHMPAVAAWPGSRAIAESRDGPGGRGRTFRHVCITACGRGANWNPIQMK